LGQNGAGKTTTIKLLSGLSSPTQGQIFVEGMDMASESEKIKELLGLVPQDSGFYAERTALSHMLYYGRLKGLNKKASRKQAQLLLSRVGLATERFKKVGSFSHGMKTRLGIAQALLNEPKILILDEPTNGLDPLGARQIRQILKECGNKGITIFLSSHKLLEVQESCTHIGILDKGKLVAESTIEKLRHLEAGGLITVGVYNLSSEIISLIEAQKFVIKTELKARDLLEISVNSRKDVKPEINRLIVECGGRVFKLMENSLSLEEAYFEATGLKQ